MTLSPATAVAFAVSGDSPSDVREWVTVDLAGHPSPYRRGFAVLAEPLTPSGRGQELARHAREIILQELRRHHRQPADAALVRAFGVANSVIFDEGRFPGGVGQQYLVGATAIVFEDHRATIAHVPPGQFILAQDGLVYSIPELASWLPSYAEPPDDGPTPEPLGYASWTAPLLVQTELRAGDSLVLCNARLGEALALESVDAGLNQRTLMHFHGRDPDKVLETLRDVVIDRGEDAAAAAVIAFPPLSQSAQIATFADIGRNAREQWRHGRAFLHQFKPAPRPKRKKQSSQPQASPAMATMTPVDDADVVMADETPMVRQRKVPRHERFQERLIRLTERRSTDWRDTWRQPNEVRQFGVPGAHGVNVFRENSTLAGESSWKNSLPRLPLLRSPAFLMTCGILILLLMAGAFLERDRFLSPDVDYDALIAEVDQRLVNLDTMTNPEALEDELTRAQQDLDVARKAGAPDNLVWPRQNQIILERDELHGVIRLADVVRVGSLPEELQSSASRAIHTPGGIFLANGSLYRLRPEAREIQRVLATGTDVEGVKVGDLFGVAYDGDYLYATDGSYVYFAGNAEGSVWQAMQLEEINEQGPWPEGPIAAFGQNMYILVAEYRNVYLFATDSEQTSTPPVDWVLTSVRASLNRAVDMTIDGNIYILLDDGRVLTFRQGDQIGEFSLPSVDPETETPLAIIGGPLTGYLYIAVVDESGQGRVIAVDREGGNMRQLALPPGFSTGNARVDSPFDGLQDIAVDEASGTLYLINGDGVWTARYSLPPLPEPEGTPEATPSSEE
jgi:sugar lactone lactonase YvrE